MKRVSNWVVGTLLMCLTVFVLSACGGGGGSAGSAQAFKLFASDDLNTGYDHVWVTIDKVSLMNGSTPTVVFDQTSAGGVTVDLRTLRDSSGARFRLLGSHPVPAGSYTGIDITVGSALSIVPTGSSSAVAATFAGSSGATTDLTLSFASAKTINGETELDVDFDLANWTLSGGVVSAPNGQFLKLGDTSTLGDPSRHEKEDLEGIVSNLAGTAPIQTFTLGGDEATVTIATTAATTLYNSDGSASPALANGEHVHVSGVFDPTTGNFDASAIKIRVRGESAEHAHAKGLVTASDAVAGTLTIAVDEAEDFLPSGASLNITTDSSTLFFDSSGLALTEAQFFAALTSTSRIEAGGNYSAGTLAATFVRIEEGSGQGEGGDGGDHGGGDHHHDADIQGTASAFDPVGLTATIVVQEWEGVSLTAGASVSVTMTSQTTFQANGSPQSAAQFAALLTSTSVVDVQGSYDTATGTLTADHVRLNSDH